MLKSALRALVDKYSLTMVCTPNQSVILRDISPEQREGVEAILNSYGVKPIEQVGLDGSVTARGPRRMRNFRGTSLWVLLLPRLLVSASVLKG